jgi:hypothetical protein
MGVDDQGLPDDIEPESQYTREFMKNSIASIRLISALGFCCLALGVSAQSQPEAAPVPTAAPPAVVEIAPPKVPYGIEDIVKLSKAQVNEEVIVKYIQNSGTIYTLTPKEIVYLRDQGVSDRVVHTMLDQRRNVSETAAQVQPVAEPAAAPVPAPAPTFANPPPADAAPAQASAPASTVYVIPHPTTYSYYAYPGPYYYPYYGYYGGYWGPSFAFRFGYGGHGHYGHYHYRH